ncbi:MAG: imelysin family protein [Actinomycetota bacterium]
MNLIRTALAVSLALIAVACGSSGPDRADTLAALADEHVVPAYAAFAADAAVLRDTTEALCASPSDATLATAQDAMIAARASWKVTEAMWVGPVMDRRSFTLIDWRTSTDQIESLIANLDLTIDPELLAKSIGSDQRGLGALEYLLFTEPVLAALENDRRCAYASGLAVVIDDEAQGIVEAWVDGQDGEPPFTESFPVENNRHLDALVNDQLIMLRKMASAELGGALGFMPTEPGAEALIEGPAGIGRTDFVQRLAGLRASLIGVGDGGLAPNLSDGLVERLTTALDASEDALAAVPDGPIRVTFDADPDALSSLRDALDEVRGLVATEVVSELGVAVGFSDADGDSGG